VTLTEFLLARIGEDERNAQDATILPDHVRKVAKFRFWPGMPGEPIEIGSWGWNGGPTPPLADDDLESRRLREIFDVPPEGIPDLPFFVVDGGTQDRNDPDEFSWRLAQVPADAGGVACHIARWDPARVLVECAAKRRIVELHTGTPYYERRYPGYVVCVRCGNPDTGEAAEVEWPCETLRAIASVYAYDPDYRDEWAL
jgi:hypothetical protein